MEKTLRLTKKKYETARRVLCNIVILLIGSIGKMVMLSTIDDATLMKVAFALGEDEAVRLIEYLKSVDETTDDEIANKTAIRLNSVRKILYKLYDHSLVSLRRTRDPKTGWFIFHWKLQPSQLEGFILSQKRRVLEKLNVRLEYEKKHDFYFCNSAECKRVTFEDAVELVFHCNTCGKPLGHFGNEHMISKLSEKVEILRKELGE
jgi:transcription initiation factor TFIIE subunit alpha